MKKVYGPRVWYFYLIFAIVVFSAFSSLGGISKNGIPWPLEILMVLFAAVLAKILFFPLFTYDDKGFSSVMIPGVTQPHFHPWSDVISIMPNTVTRHFTGYMINLKKSPYIVARTQLSKEDLDALGDIIKLTKGANARVKVDAGLLKQAGLSGDFAVHPQDEPPTPAPTRVVDSIHYAHHIPLMTGLLMLVNILVFQAELAYGVDAPKPNHTPGWGTLSALGGNSWDLAVDRGEWWRPVTAIFLHSNPGHLSGNMISLFFAGTFLEDYVGRTCFFTLFLFGGIGAYLLSMTLQPHSMICLGASGAIMALLAADLVLSFRLPVSSVRAWVTYYSFRVLVPGLTPSLTIPRHIDLYGHLGGALTGALAGLIILAFWKKGEPRPVLEPLFRAAFVAGLVLMGVAGFSQANAYERYSLYYGRVQGLEQIEKVKDPEVLLHWGYLCREGKEDGVKDLHRAFLCYKLAAQMGNREGQFNYGYMYDKGLWVKRNDPEAFFWYQKSALQGNADAENNMGSMCLDGRGTKKDPYEAVRWYRLSADQGQLFAKAHLGFCYETGRGVGKDPKEALRLYHLSADKGNMAGEFFMGLGYEKGTILPKDFSKARDWYKKSADQGYEPAKKNLALLNKKKVA